MPRHAHEAGWRCGGRWLILAAGCAVVGLCPAPALRALAPALRLVDAARRMAAVAGALADAATPLWMITAVAAALLAAGRCSWPRCAGGCWRAGAVEETVTWDCGYAAPTARMQYTASSFAQPLTELFRLVLRTRVRLVAPDGPLPGASRCWSRETPDVCREAVFRPAFAGIRRALDRLRWLQHGRMQLYVLYIVLTLLALLVWKLR